MLFASYQNEADLDDHSCCWHHSVHVPSHTLHMSAGLLKVDFTTQCLLLPSLSAVFVVGSCSVILWALMPFFVVVVVYK